MLLVSATTQGLCGSSTYLEYIERPISNGCALEKNTMDFISHVIDVYWETP
jgi:hypothetical protein